MRQGTTSSVPETHERFDTLETARSAARRALADLRVLRVMIVTDGVRSTFVEWIER
jgi:hypothetical protein